MNIFIDCEWNGHKGQLISMALVDEEGNEFYEVLACHEPIEWVANNVIPVLGKAPISQEEFDEKLRVFLCEYDQINIIADWIEDISYFCNALVIKPLHRIGLRKMSFVVDGALFAATSEIPHNALADARAIKECYELLNES